MISTKTADISVESTAQIIRCSQTTVLRLIEAGEIEAYRLTPRGHWRVDRESVNRYLAKLKNTRS